MLKLGTNFSFYIRSGLCSSDRIIDSISNNKTVLVVPSTNSTFLSRGFMGEPITTLEEVGGEAELGFV